MEAERSESVEDPGERIETASAPVICSAMRSK
jgi:hypothetical protein